MRHLRYALILLFLLAGTVGAQTATVQFTAPDNALTTAAAAGLEYKIYVNASATGVVLTGVTCTGATAPFLCTAPLPAAAAAARTLGARSELTAAITGTAGTESAKSPPFTTGPTAPRGLSILP